MNTSNSVMLKIHLQQSKKKSDETNQNKGQGNTTLVPCEHLRVNLEHSLQLQQIAQISPEFYLFVYFYVWSVAPIDYYSWTYGGQPQTMVVQAGFFMWLQLSRLALLPCILQDNFLSNRLMGKIDGQCMGISWPLGNSKKSVDPSGIWLLVIEFTIPAC